MEDNELALVEGEMVEDIEQLDENWWTGTGPGGQSGLFPGMVPPFKKLSSRWLSYRLITNSELCRSC